MNLYWATHPDFPNKDGRARSRVYHYLDKSGKFQKKRGNKKRYTMCGMLAIEMAKNPSELRGNCQVCESQNELLRKLAQVENEN